MSEYGKKASESVERAIRKRNHGTLKIGESNKLVKSRAQAIAIGLSEARKQGGKVPDLPVSKSPAKQAASKKAVTKKAVSKRATAKKTTLRTTTSKKTASRKSA